MGRSPKRPDQNSTNAIPHPGSVLPRNQRNKRTAAFVPGVMRIILQVLMAAVFAGLAFGQSHPSNAAKPGDELFEEMAQLDKRMFDAFNSCKLDEFTAMFDDDVEFYHDQSGVTLGTAKVAEQVKASICGKARRELVAGSLTVYPMRDFGALLVGRHRFYQSARGSEPTGVAQFIHLARKTNGAWKVTRVISFDHVGLAPRK